MNKYYRNHPKNLNFLLVFCGAAISIPAIIITGINIAVAQQTPESQPISQPIIKVNPCPRIFYEEPHNNRVLVPQGCPPNEITRRYAAQGLNTTPITGNPTPEQIRLGVGGENPTSQTIPSPRQQQQQVVATVTPTNNRISIRLVNETNTPITYQAVGDTAQRTLAGKSSITLQSLQIPTTVTFYRPDRGLLQATPTSVSQGKLELKLDETNDFATDSTTLRIENNGNVFLN